MLGNFAQCIEYKVDTICLEDCDETAGLRSE